MARCCALCFKTAPPFWFKVMTADCRLCTGCPRWMHDKTCLACQSPRKHTGGTTFPGGSPNQQAVAKQCLLNQWKRRSPSSPALPIGWVVQRVASIKGTMDSRDSCAICAEVLFTVIKSKNWVLQFYLPVVTPWGLHFPTHHILQENKMDNAWLWIDQGQSPPTSRPML